jgi:flagellar basal body-associated protein FliL
MVLPLDGLWFAILISFLAVFCTAPLMSARVFLVLILVIIVVGLALTIVSMVFKRRRAPQEASDKATLLEYLKAHGLGGNLLQLAESLGFSEDRTLKLLLSLEEEGAIPPGSSKAFSAGSPDTARVQP